MTKPEPKISTADTQSYLQTHTRVRQWINRFKPQTQRLYARMILEFEQLTRLNIETLLDQATHNKLKPVEIRSLINEATKHLTNPKQIMIDAALEASSDTGTNPYRQPISNTTTATHTDATPKPNYRTSSASSTNHSKNSTLSSQQRADSEHQRYSN